jgi:hypothetical protein
MAEIYHILMAFCVRLIGNFTAFNEVSSMLSIGVWGLSCFGVVFEVRWIGRLKVCLKVLPNFSFDLEAMSIERKVCLSVCLSMYLSFLSKTLSVCLSIYILSVCLYFVH